MSPRQLAQAEGRTRYLGKPCKKHGHVGWRNTSGGHCIECGLLDNPGLREYRNLWRRMDRRNHPENRKEADRRHYLKYRESILRRKALNPNTYKSDAHRNAVTANTLRLLYYPETF